MEDKQKLTAAILIAIVAYLQIEQASLAASVLSSQKESGGQTRSP
jgi:hypothetical protein